MSRKRPVPDDLPTLTEVVGDTTGGFPTLTEVVGEATGDFPTLTEVVAVPTDSVPVLTEVIAYPEALASQPAPIPSATEDNTVVPAEGDGSSLAPPPEQPSDLLPRLHRDVEAHIETVFAQKLQQHLATAQQRAVELAIAELKDELPDLIQAALAKPHTPS